MTTLLEKTWENGDQPSDLLRNIRNQMIWHLLAWHVQTPRFLLKWRQRGERIDCRVPHWNKPHQVTTRLSWSWSTNCSWSKTKTAREKNRIRHIHNVWNGLPSTCHTSMGSRVQNVWILHFFDLENTLDIKTFGFRENQWTTSTQSGWLPSGKHTKNYWISAHLIGKST